MARIDTCTNCGEVKEIRRRSGECDSCYHKRYRERPGVKDKMNARAAAWRTQHAEEVRAYNEQYYIRMKGSYERSRRQTRGTEGQD